MCSFRGSFANRGNGTEQSSSDVVHRGNPYPNQRSVLHGAGLGGDWLFPPNNLSEADHTAAQPRHQKGENPVRILPFLVREAGLEVHVFYFMYYNPSILAKYK